MDGDGLPDLSPAEQPKLEINIPPEIWPGKWINAASVARTAHEFTIDLIKIGPAGQSGAVIARILMSPLMLSELLEQLQTQWDEYQSSQPE